MSSKKINVVLIGYGYWGKRLAATIASNPFFNLAMIVESDPIKRNIALNLFNIPVFENYINLNYLNVDFCVIATRPGSHLSIAEFFLPRKIPCLITKPVTSSLIEAKRLRNLSRSSGTKIFVDYTYLYSGYLHEIKKWVKTSIQLESYTSHRSSLGIIQADVSVMEDLGSHDIANLVYLLDELPSVVRMAPMLKNRNFSYQDNFFSLSWQDNFIANVFVSWRSPKKIRNITLMAANEALILDEMSENPLSTITFEQDFKQTNIDSEENFEKRNISYSMGPIRAIPIDKKTPLEIEFERIANVLLARELEEYVCMDDLFIDVWKVMEALKESSLNEGAEINVKK